MTFDPNRLLPDSALTTYTPLDLDAFFQSIASPLATLSLPGGSVASQLDQVARQVGLDPRVLVVKLQVEQSLVTQPSTPDRLDWALGYGVPDDGPPDPHYRGFSTQLQAAAQTLQGYLDPSNPLTVVGLVGQPMTVSDGVVTPATLATAALYRYTPWIGDQPSGSLVPPFGNCLFSQVWSEFFNSSSFEPSQPAPAPAPPTGDWRLIAPPNRWQDPIPFPETTLALLQEVASRLGLRCTTDTPQQKLYLGLPLPHPSTALTYPSGYQATLAPTLTPLEAAHYAPAQTGPPAPLVVADPQALLSPHFKMGEFLPHQASYPYLRLAPALVQLLEALRHQLGDVPLQVNSAYRPPDYNTSVGGASESVHTDGLAADVSCPSVTFEQLASAAEQLVGDRGGLGRYPALSYVHVDLRGSRARWP